MTATAQQPKKILKFKLRTGRYIGPVRDAVGQPVREPVVKSGKETIGRDGKPLTRIKRTVHLAKDPRTNIISTTEDLAAKFGRHRFEPLLDSATGLAPGQEVWDKNKESFEDFRRRVGQAEPQAADDESDVENIKVPKGDEGVLKTLKGMTVAELREQARRDEVDVGSAKTKAEIIKLLIGVK